MKDELEAVLDKYRSHPQFLGMELVDPNQRGAVDDTPLHLAARQGAIRDVEILVAYGAEINLAGELGNTALHCAALCGEAEMVKRLLELGADPSLANEFGQTALQLAQLDNHYEAETALQNGEWRAPSPLDRR